MQPTSAQTWTSQPRSGFVCIPTTTISHCLSTCNDVPAGEVLYPSALEAANLSTDLDIGPARSGFVCILTTISAHCLSACMMFLQERYRSALEAANLSTDLDVVGPAGSGGTARRNSLGMRRTSSTGVESTGPLSRRSSTGLARRNSTGYPQRSGSTGVGAEVVVAAVNEVG
jgi:hypothetical protein